MHKATILQRAQRAASLGRVPLAIKLLRAHLNNDPHDRDAVLNLGDLLIKAEAYAEAAELYGAHLQRAPSDPIMLSNLGAAMLRLERLTEARSLLEYALELDPKLLFARINLGGVLQGLGDYRGALENALEAVAIDPTHPLTFNNLGSAFSDLSMNQEAKHAYETSLMLDPSQIDTRVNLATAAMKVDDFDLALQLYEEVACSLPPEAKLRRESILFFAAFPAFSLGLWEKAWNYYEYGFGQLIPIGAARSPKRVFDAPRWVGERKSGKRLLVWREQGVGDEVLFASILPELEHSGMRVIFECDSRLVSVWRRSFPSIEVREAIFNQADMSPIYSDYDFHVPLCSLGRIFRGCLEDFSRGGPYIVPDFSLRNHLQSRVNAAAGQRLKIGFLWRSIRLTPTRNKGYTLPVSWEGVLDRADLCFFGLQYNVTEEEILDAERKFGRPLNQFRDLNYKDDFESAVAMLSLMDIVISPDTTMFELAGAMGIPTICMTVGPTGHYGMRERFPFYPSVHVITCDSVDEDATDLLKKLPSALDHMIRNIQSYIQPAEWREAVARAT